MHGRTFWYLATSYTKHPLGLEAAYHMAADATQMLMLAKIAVFSPIVHSHPLAVAFDLPQTHEFWMEADVPMMAGAHGCIVLKDGGWEVSRGVQEEIERFTSMGKPILYMTPGIVPVNAITGALAQTGVSGFGISPWDEPPRTPPLPRKAKVVKFTKKEA